MHDLYPVADTANRRPSGPGAAGGARLAHVQPEPFDLLIIGAGPVGLFGAFYAGLRGLSTMLLDSLPEAGGQVAAMYPEKDILDVAGFARVRGRDLVTG